jgi:hypothetical protein
MYNIFDCKAFGIRFCITDLNSSTNPLNPPTFLGKRSLHFSRDERVALSATLKVAHLTPILVGFMIRAIAIADIAPAMYKLDQKFSVFSGYQADCLSNTLVWSSPCMRARKLVEHMERQLCGAHFMKHTTSTHLPALLVEAQPFS